MKQMYLICPLSHLMQLKSLPAHWVIVQTNPTLPNMQSMQFPWSLYLLYSRLSPPPSLQPLEHRAHTEVQGFFSSIYLKWFYEILK